MVTRKAKYRYDVTHTKTPMHVSSMEIGPTMPTMSKSFPKLSTISPKRKTKDGSARPVRIEVK